MALLLVAGGPLAQGAPSATGEQRVALVIGNAAYKEAPLRNPVNDATDVAQALKELGFAVTLRTNATHKEMEQAIQKFGVDIHRGGVGLFFFAGHGIQSRGGNYLIPIGANIQSEADLKFQSVDAGWVLAQMEDARNRVNIVILDACRNNPYSRGFRSASRGLAQMDAAKGSFLAFATAPGDVAQDGTGRNGTYTKHLLASLRQPESDIFQVFSRVGQAVAQETREQQIPWFNSSLTGRFQFRSESGAQVASVSPSAAEIPRADSMAVELAFWESIKGSRNQDDFKAYLDRFPNGQFVELARNRIGEISKFADAMPTSRVDSSSGGGIKVGFIDVQRLLREANLSGTPDAMDRANALVSSFAQANGISLILQEAVYSNARVDITSDIVKAVKGEAPPAVGAKWQSVSEVKVGYVNLNSILESEWNRGNRDKPKVMASANRVIESIAMAYGLDMVLQSAVAVSQKADITQDVVRSLDGAQPDRARIAFFSNTSLRIGFVSANRIVRESAPAVEASDRITSEFEARKKQLSDGDMAGQAAWKKDLSIRRNEELRKVIALADKTIRAIADADRLDIVLQEAVFRDNALDITDRVLGALR